MYERVQTASALAGADMGQLPRGRHRIPREEVLESQRRRLLSGIAAALAEQGFARLTVEHVIANAGVSRKTFYEHFESREQCLLAAYDAASAQLWEAGEGAAAAVAEWPARVLAATAAALRFLAADPDRAHLFTVEARVAGEEMAARTRADVERAAALLSAGAKGEAAGGEAAGRDAPGGEGAAPAPAAPRAEALPAATATTLVDNVAAVVGANILSGATAILPDQAPKLAEYLLAPYIGAERAREATRAQPPAHAPAAPAEEAA